MTKGEIKKLASDVTLMDILNTISGLLELDKPSDQELINQLVDDVYNKLKSKE